MVDHLSAAKRSELMAKIRGKNTKPEMIVRKQIWNAGFRYRLHRADLPGKPDLVFPSRQKVIFINGCFWHGHKCKSLPKTRKKFWKEKIENNKRRDRRALNELRKMGWSCMTVWECSIKEQKTLQQIVDFLNK